MASLLDRLKEWIGSEVVVDSPSRFVAIGTLAALGDDYLELRDVDLHDLRDTDTTREIYVMKTARYGVSANRKSLIYRLAEVLAVSRLSDVETG